MAGATIGDLMDWLLGTSAGKDCPTWPPDVFAVVGSVLQRSGAYVYAVDPKDGDGKRLKWPPG